MTNFFTYDYDNGAQHAFLSYLLSSLDKPNVGDITRNLISCFIKKSLNQDIDPLSIESVHVKTQCKTQFADLDILCEVFTTKSFYALAILDGINDEERFGSISKLRNLGLKYKNVNVVKIYYRNDELFDNEKDNIAHMGWTPFELVDIYRFFSKVKSQNPFVKEYKDYIKGLYNELIAAPDVAFADYSKIELHNFITSDLQNAIVDEFGKVPSRIEVDDGEIRLIMDFAVTNSLYNATTQILARFRKATISFFVSCNYVNESGEHVECLFDTNNVVVESVKNKIANNESKYFQISTERSNHIAKPSRNKFLFGKAIMISPKTRKEFVVKSVMKRIKDALNLFDYQNGLL